MLLTGIAAAITGGVSMATGSYLGARTEKEIFEKELLDQDGWRKHQPYLAQEALLESLVGEGLDRPSAYRVVQIFSRHRSSWAARSRRRCSDSDRPTSPSR